MVTKNEETNKSEKIDNIYSLMVKNTQFGMSVSTLDGKILETNPALYMMFGFENKEEFMKYPSTEYYFDLEDRKEVILQLQTNGFIDNLEFRVKRKDGEVFWISVSSYVIETENNDKLLLTTHVDVTERKETEIKLQMQSSALESSIAAFGMADMNGKITYVNQAYLEMWEYSSREEVIGQQISGELKDPKMEKLVLSKLKKEGIFEGEIAGKKKDGSTFYFHVFITLQKNQSGVPHGMVASFLDISNRKETETQFEELFNNMKSGVAIYEAVDNGKDFIFKDFNKAGENIEQVKKETLIGKRVTEAFPGVEDLGLLGVFQEVWKTGEPAFHPISFYQGGEISGWRENYVYRLPQGEIVSIYDDVTENKKHETELKKKDLALETSVLGIVMADLKGKITYVNPKLLDMWGFKKEHIKYGETSATALAQSSPKIVGGMIDELKTKGTYSNEFLSMKVDKTPFWVSMNAHTIFDEDSQPVGWMSSFLDITEKKQKEEELRIRNLAIESSVNAFGMSDLDEIVTYVNEACIKMWGYQSTEDILGRPVSEFFAGEKEFKHMMNEVKTKGEFQGEIFGVSSDGSFFDVYANLSLVMDEKNNPISLMGFFEDITEKKEIERELKHSTIAKELVGEMFRDLKSIGNLSNRTIFLAGKKLANQLNHTSISDYLSSFHNMGLGELKLIEESFEQGRWVFLGSTLVEKTESTTPTGNYALGFLCEIISKITHKSNVVGVELECQSTGDEFCKFVIQQK